MTTTVNPDPEVNPMSIETPHDWKGLRRAGHVAHLALDALAAHVRPGITTAELDAVAARLFAKHGARSAPAMVYGFPGTVLISVNDEIVHGVPGGRVLRAGDIVKLDVTLEKGGYIADAARTVSVGAPDERVSRLIACARAAFEAALPAARAGNQVNEIGRAIEREVRRAGCSVIRGLTGHGVGRTIHESPSVPNQYNPFQRDVLTEGLVLTIEPLVCDGSGEAVEDEDGWTIRTRDGSLAAHHEHTLVITRDSPILLTAA
jgi:methionyl aminopeptidase